jgi:hypothetical protein
MVKRRRDAHVRQRRWPVRVLGALLVATGVGVTATRAYSHPLHTTLSELTVTPDGSVQIVLRAFVDDFSAAVAGKVGALPAPTATPPDSATARYVGDALALTDASGRRVFLGLAGVRRSGDLVWVTLRSPAARSVAGARLTNRVLFVRYDDQDNIVQTTVAGKRRTLLFTKRDGTTPKAL